MQVTSVGHAGFLIETRAGSILCDPWVNPAYFASWFPFPDNSGLDWAALGDVDYLYVSHLHKDHFDPELLTAHVNKDAVVLLPDYPVPDLRNPFLGVHVTVTVDVATPSATTGLVPVMLELAAMGVPAVKVTEPSVFATGVRIASVLLSALVEESVQLATPLASVAEQAL